MSKENGEEKRQEYCRELHRQMGTAMAQVMIDEETWQGRIDGPVYRQTPLLGRFRWYRSLRVWHLRRSLKP